MEFEENESVGQGNGKDLCTWVVKFWTAKPTIIHKIFETNSSFHVK